MKNLKLTLVLFASFAISVVYAQKSQIDCRVMLNQVDALLAKKDTLGAVRLYEAIDKEKCIK